MGARNKASGDTPSVAADDFVARGRIVSADLALGQALLHRALLDGGDTAAARKLIGAAAAESKRLAQEMLARLSAEEAARQAKIESTGDAVLDESLQKLSKRLSTLMPPRLPVDWS